VTDRAAAKRRLDLELVARGLVPSRERAQVLILGGAVTVNGERVTRPSVRISEGAALHVRSDPDYVGRGAAKLAHALDAFHLDPAGLVCIDVGASTGGFTDVLLRRGASRVYAIDVGKGQLAWRLRQDPRVVVMEGVNVRELRSLPEKCDLAVADVSFISLRLALPPVLPFVRDGGDVISLVKPQFEVGPARVAKGGIVRDASARMSAVVEIVQALAEHDLGVQAITRSPIRGREGNVEIFVHLKKGRPAAIDVALEVAQVAS
jgi:23S rRNA (cytidine1920-2'-O)/16S rRNA (cytidine1409-2'-O)-methyltransferase